MLFSRLHSVPLQNNTWDCGVFVCRYAYAIYELRDRDFTYGDAGMHCENTEVITGLSSRAFQELISDGAEFDFNMDDIARFRDEFKTLIENLSRLYVKAKSAEKHAILEEKMKRQAAAGTGMSTVEKDDETATIKVVEACEPFIESEDESPAEVVAGLAVSLPIAISNEKENRKDEEVLKDMMAIDGLCYSQSSEEGITKAMEFCPERARQTCSNQCEETAFL